MTNNFNSVLSQLQLAALLIKRSKERDNSDLYARIDTQVDLENAEAIINTLEEM